MNELETSRHYTNAEKLIQFLCEQSNKQPTLRDIAQRACMSESHAQRVFTEWVGLSPKQFLQAISRSKAKELLPNHSVAETADMLGYSSESRLYDNFVRIESITPGEYKSRGKNLEITFGFAPTPYGDALFASTQRGIMKLAFTSSSLSRDDLINELKSEWHNAEFIRDDNLAKTLNQQVFSNRESNQNVTLFVKASVFQVKVWEALLTIPEGELRTYQQIAETSGNVKAVRAAASAIANNPVACLIPCHRVIRSSGVLNQYRWGADRKAVMLLRESGNRILNQ